MFSFLDDEEDLGRKPLDPTVMDFMAKKYQLNGPPKELAPIDPRAQAQQQYESKQRNIDLGSIASGFGDALAGREVGSQDKYFQGLKDQAKENTIGKLDADRKRGMDDATFKNQQMEAKSKQDQNDHGSAASQSFRKMIEAKFPEVAKAYGDSWSGVSAADSDNIFKPLQLKETIDARKQQYQLALQGKQAALNEKKLEKELKNSPEERLKNLSGTDKARYDNALMVLKGLDQMGQALDSGEDTMSAVGDNNYTKAARSATEGYGRMQSGGAINKEEEARFDRTLPRLTDKKEIQRKKILDQRAEMLSRLHTLGFTPEQAKYAPVDFKYGSDDSQVSSASAGSKPKTVNQNGHTYILNEKTGQYE